MLVNQVQHQKAAKRKGPRTVMVRSMDSEVWAEIKSAAAGCDMSLAVYLTYCHQLQVRGQTA